MVLTLQREGIKSEIEKNEVEFGEVDGGGTSIRLRTKYYALSWCVSIHAFCITRVESNLFLQGKPSLLLSPTLIHL